MNEKPRQILSDLIAKYGTSLADEPARCRGLLRDLCGNHKAEIHVLIAAMEEGIPDALRKGMSLAGSPEVIVARQVLRLQDDRGLTEDNARWAVESWALALGVIATGSAPPPPDSSLAPEPELIVPPATPTPVADWKGKGVLAAVLGLGVLAALIALVLNINGQVAREREEKLKAQNGQQRAEEALRYEQRKAQEQEQQRKVERARIEIPSTSVEITKRPQSSRRQPPQQSSQAVESVVRGYYAAVGRGAVSEAMRQWKDPANKPKTEALIKNTESTDMREAKAEEVNEDRAVVRVDVVVKARGKSAPERWQGNVELEPTVDGRWGIVKMNLSPTDRLRATAPPPTVPAEVAGADAAVARVREYYAALDRRDVAVAGAIRKTPPANFAGLVANIDYFKVNDARLVRADGSEASVWVDVIGKTHGAAASERWRGEIGLELTASGQWLIVAMNLRK